MERRVLLAIFLCFLVLYLWQALVVKPVPKPAAGTTPAAAAGGAQGAGKPGAASSAGSSPPAPGAPATIPAAPTAAPLVGDTAEHDVRVETQDVVAVFT